MGREVHHAPARCNAGQFLTGSRRCGGNSLEVGKMGNKNRPYYAEIVIRLAAQLEDIEKRHRANTDIVMGDVLIASILKRQDEIRRYAKEEPTMFAQLIANGDIGASYMQYLSKSKYKIHPINLSVVPILKQSEIDGVVRDVCWYEKQAKRDGNWK